MDFFIALNQSILLAVKPLPICIASAKGAIAACAPSTIELSEMFLLGLSLRPSQFVNRAIQGYESIGAATAEAIMHRASIHPLCRVRDLNDIHLAKLKPLIQATLEENRERKLIRMKMKKQQDAIKSSLSFKGVF